MSSMRTALIPTVFILPLLMLAAAAPAAPLGNVRSVAAAQGDGPTWILVTDSGAQLRVSLPRDNVIHVAASPNGTFAGAGDKAAPIVVAAAAANVPHRFSENASQIVIGTAALTLSIERRPLRLTLARAGEASPLWRELQPIDLADKRSVQVISSTADEHFYGGGQQNGHFEFKGSEIPVSYSGGWEEGDRPNPAPFLMSSRGWGVLRNTWADGRYDLREPDRATLEHGEQRFDAYYFVGKDMHEVLGLYTEWTGRARMLPRWALEFGDADCYNDGDNVKKPGTVPPGWSDGPTGKTPDVVDSVARQYRQHDMPGGWILPNDGYGCGYSALPETVKGLAGYGFRTGLWTENGVDKINWEVGQAGTRVQKLDVAWTGKGYQFSLDANKAAYDGILNNSDSRPFIWTVMGWAGTQRYAVAWTGDQSASWDYIRWHVPTLIGSGLSGQAYASGDVDAIFGGSPETYTRDLQWKSFTPVLMGMSGWSSAERKHPWWFEEPYRSINRRYLKLKMRLTPYMYTLAREAETTGAPLVRGLMWDYPQDPAAAGETYRNKFLLGRDLLVAPVYRSQAASGGWRSGIHLPQGRWFDYWDGRQATAPASGRDVDLQVTLDKLPVFVRAGAILPMYPEMLYDGQKPKDVLTLDLYPAGRSQFDLYEDDGSTRQYQQGAASLQKIRMHEEQGRVDVELGAVEGSYAGQEARRAYALRVLMRQRPAQVLADGAALAALDGRAAFDAAGAGWYFDAADRQGTLHVKTPPRDIRQPLRFTLAAPAAILADDSFPAAPTPGRAIAADAIMVVNRPAEEPGQPLENAFDGKPDTWFRSIRNQAIRSGAIEWVVGFNERRLIDGIEIAPRNDKNWKNGQVRDYEVYVGDRNGEWGEPVKRGRLALAQQMQTIEFAPVAGRLLRFRVLSTHNPEGDGATALDPMVTAAGGAAAAPARAFDANVPPEVAPIAIATFHVLEHLPPAGAEQRRYLSDLALPAALRRDRPAGGGAAMRMNGLHFRKGVGAGASSRVDFALAGNWRLLRADLGIDDSCRAAGGLQFQVWSGAKLLYDSGLVTAPAVVKPEIDLRGLSAISLRTLGAKGAQPSRVCGNWANAVLIGAEGARVTAP